MNSCYTLRPLVVAIPWNTNTNVPFHSHSGSSPNPNGGNPIKGEPNPLCPSHKNTYPPPSHNQPSPTLPNLAHSTQRAKRTRNVVSRRTLGLSHSSFPLPAS